MPCLLNLRRGVEFGLNCASSVREEILISAMNPSFFIPNKIRWFRIAAIKIMVVARRCWPS